MFKNAGYKLTVCWQTLINETENDKNFIETLAAFVGKSAAVLPVQGLSVHRQGRQGNNGLLKLTTQNSGFITCLRPEFSRGNKGDDG